MYYLQEGSHFVVWQYFVRRRVSIAEKYRPVLKKLAEEKQGKRTDLTSGRNLQEVDKPVHTRDELAKIAGVSHDTYGFYRIFLNV